MPARHCTAVTADLPTLPPPLPTACSASGTAFSFNGGKDSTVLLHIIRAVVEQRRRQGVALEGAVAANGDSSSGSSSTAAAPAPLGGVLTFFFHHDTDFSEVVEFTRGTDQQYG